ncbi:hypothetical protein [Streptomyces sp. NPDC001404]|uniref:hypothetical protein n=1 Tax=Streptomyces sp. NPDC001404 TaxID=3364571 RepID=UPI0036A05E9F
MPLNTVQAHLKSLLDGTVLPYDAGALSAFIAPPDPGDGMQPSVYIWGSIATDARQSMPRGMGFRLIAHEIDLWLIWVAPNDDPYADSAFPGILDAVVQQLRTAPMPVLNQPDPANTGVVSDLLKIGERVRWDYAPVHSIEDQRYWVYTARIICDVTEKLQA